MAVVTKAFGSSREIFRTDRVNNATRLLPSACELLPAIESAAHVFACPECCDTRTLTPSLFQSLTDNAMPSTEAKLLSDFLVAPASLRDFMSLRQFTDIFPKAHRANPAVKDLYRELYTLRERDIESVRQDIALEVKRSKPLRRDCARKRRQLDEANVAGLDPVALGMEAEASSRLAPRGSWSDTG